MIAAAPGLLVRSLGHPEYRAHLSERFGSIPSDLSGRLARLPRRPIWVQAVSVGEVLLASSLMQALERHAATPFVLSSTTPAGRAAAASIKVTSLQGVFHFPIDWSPFVRRLLDAVDPSLFIAIETEIWPGLLRQCARRRLPSLIVNGRISERSYGRYRKVRGLLRAPLDAVRLACMQSDVDAERIRSIGLAPDRIVVTGNMKFDLSAATAEEPDQIAARLGVDLAPDSSRTVIVAGSTSAGEEGILLDALDSLRGSGIGDLLLVLAPRHPDRFDEVGRLLQARGLRFRRRTASTGPLEPIDVLLLDTIGELASAYSIATIAFVGGSLVPRGGQNLIEPPARGVPVLFGPHTENFSAVADALVAAGAGFRVAGSQDLAATLRRLIVGDVERRRAGEAGRALIEAHRGATDRTVAHILPFLG